MGKRFILLVSIFFSLFSLISPLQALEVSSEAYLLYDLDNECILYEKNSQEVRSVASLTKLMAVLVAIEQIDDLKETIIVDGDLITGYYDYTKVGLSDGDVVTYEDLLYGMMLPSGADAALLITYHVAGSEESFAKLMNQKAKELGMVNSHFDNAVGKDSVNNYSTAQDLLKLIKYALKNETFYTIFTTKKYEIEHLDIEMESTLYYYTENTDYDVSMIEGSKTGYTDEAGYCLASLSRHDTQPVLLITLGGDEDVKTSAIQDSLAIYEDFTSQYHYQEVLSEGEVITTLPIELGWKKTYTVTMPETVYGFVKDKDDWYVQFAGVENINRNIKKGDYIGRVEVYQEGYLLQSYDLYLEKTIFYHYPLIYALGFVAIMLTVLIKKIKQMRRKRRRRHR